MSSINIAIPSAADPYIEDVIDNFTAAKNDIDALESAITALQNVDLTYDTRLTALEAYDALLQTVSGAAEIGINDTGGYYTGADIEAALQELGASIASINSSITSINTSISTINTWISDTIPAGTRMLFQQTTPPPGWTKITTYDNVALRVVSGAVGDYTTGIAFSTLFATSKATSNTTSTGTVGNTSLTLAQMYPHNHGGGNHNHYMHYYGSWSGGQYLSNNNGYYSGGGGDNFGRLTGGPDTDLQTSYAIGGNINNTEGSGDVHTHSLTMDAHNHLIDLDVNRVDVIIAEKS